MTAETPPTPVFWSTLYKTSSRGKEQEWTIKVVAVPSIGTPLVYDCAEIIVKHGQVDGKIQTASVLVSKGKNLGKKNETTPWQQAIDEADSKYKKQLDKGYSVNRGGASMELKPMLAHKYEDRKKKVAFPAYAQPKLDGMRAIAHKHDGVVDLWSRQSKKLEGIVHIKLALRDIMKDGDVFDGELYVHGMPFQNLLSLIKREQENTKIVEYHVYDKVSDESFELRFNQAADAICASNAHISSAHVACIRIVPTHMIWSHHEVEEHHEYWVSMGYEGAMLRCGNEPYKQGYRSENLLKVKAFQDDEFEILDVVPGVGKEADKGTFVCRTEAGATFNCRPKGRDELRADYLANRDRYVGKKLTVKFFEWTTTEPPVPRFPVGVCVRDYE